MSFDKKQYVVEGEAAESDDDDAVEEIGQVNCHGDIKCPDMKTNLISPTSIVSAGRRGSKIPWHCH